ncbi:MAG: preprotein translocase subunit YajC [Dehalococcoidia bacterium]
MFEVLGSAGLVLLLFYFLFIRPTRSEQRRRRNDLNALRVGDEVLTTGGLIATVTDVETPANGPMILHLKIADGVVVKAQTAAIAERLRAGDVDEEEDEWDGEFIDDEGIDADADEWDEDERDADAGGDGSGADEMDEFASDAAAPAADEEVPARRR